jgi:cytochrome c oxidase assembly protein Cox11
MKSVLAFVFFISLIGMAFAQPQQATPDDMRTAYEMAVQQRNRSQNEQIELAITIRKIQSDFEARLETAMQWLKQAQEK